MKERSITAFTLIAVFSLALVMGNQALFVLLLGVVLIGAYEIYALRKQELRPIILALIIVLTIVGGILDNAYVSGFAMFSIMLMFSLTVVFEWFKFEHVSYIFILMMMLVLAIQSIRVVLDIDRVVFFYILLGTYMTDTAAYFGGRFFGKHKLIERISPKKTVEGAVIGYVVSAIVTFVFGVTFAQSYINMPVIIASSLLIPVVGQFGDLAFSLIKRHFNVKDFGSIFPGHGGVLDRVDSVIFTLFTFNLIIMFLG
ncbi:phosphatidate cytidylyltransferase [Erysipelothrix sp. HDW6C]|uniref:phosphatidate cytidylyltransferase n=1 Tax=Erysipelothrix sp. HDW6C TaxID=2714930 RepID=UPI0014084FDE|nr:phosphatidate cytidylyltransferase [Erysipelothrix sp. HDW6C]QIK69976.1 phosphatidate cytidylyltransferase [Erysipelothrix sp. HDW6C]